MAVAEAIKTEVGGIRTEVLGFTTQECRWSFRGDDGVRRPGNVLESTVDQGSTFRIYLPRVPATKRSQRAAEEAPPGHGSETILLAEDEAAVRRIARIALERHGYRVIEAAEGRAAFDAAERHDGRIDLLVTDVVMPEVGGRDLADRLRERRPGIGVLFLSGYIEDEIVREGISASGATFLQKPFSTLDLIRKVRALLDRGA